MEFQTDRDFYRENPRCWTIITPHGFSADFVGPTAVNEDPPHPYTLPVNDSKFRCALALSARFVPPERRLVVLPDTRGKSTLDIVRDRNCGAVLLYPEFAGTAASVFFALTRILSKDREATVIVNPLEHWLPDEGSIIKAVADAVQVVERIPQKIIILASDAAPEDQNPLRIQPGQKYRRSLFPQLWTVRNMSNGKDSEMPQRIPQEGLQYRSVVVAKAKLVWKLGFCCLPEMLPSLAWLSDEESRIASDVREIDPPVFHRNGKGSWSFTDNLLMRAPRSLAVMKLPEAC